MRSIFDRKCKSFFQSWNFHFSSVFNWYFVVHFSFDNERMTIWFVISHCHIRKVFSSPDPRYPVTCISLFMSHNDNRYWLCVQLDERILEIRISLQVFIFPCWFSWAASKIIKPMTNFFFFENWILESSHSNVTFNTLFLISCSDRIRTRLERTTTWL